MSKTTHQTIDLHEMKEFLKTNWIIFASNHPWRLYYNGNGQYKITNSYTNFELITNDIQMAVEKYNELN